MVTAFGLDISALALDMTNFATYIDTGNDKAPIAARGKAKQKRSRPAPGRARPGRHPRRRDPAGLPRLPRQPARRHPVRHHDRPAGRPRTPRPGRHRCPAAPATAETTPQMTVVFDAGQNSAANFAHLAATGAGVRRVGPAVGLRRPARPARRRPHVVDADRFPGLTALRDPPRVYGAAAARRAHPLTRPCTQAQSRGFDQTLAKADRETDRAGRHPGPR